MPPTERVAKPFKIKNPQKLIADMMTILFQPHLIAQGANNDSEQPMYAGDPLSPVGWAKVVPCPSRIEITALEGRGCQGAKTADNKHSRD